MFYSFLPTVYLNLTIPSEVQESANDIVQQNLTQSHHCVWWISMWVIFSITTQCGSTLSTVSPRGRKVGLTSPHVDRFFGRLLPWARKVGLTSPLMERSTLWTVTTPGEKGGLISPLVDGLFGTSLRGEGKSAWHVDRFFGRRIPWGRKVGQTSLLMERSTLWTVTSPGEKAGLISLLVDGLFGTSLRGDRKSAWLRLRWIDSLNRHFLERKVALASSQADRLFGQLIVKKSRPDFASDSATLWTVTSLGRKVGLISP